ncbi:MAG: site-specific integrase [Chloroflexi bacterium]|nr:site-specific integrase [Chloroflexota bacterium]
MAKARGHVRQRSPGSWQVTLELPPDPGTGQRRQHIETVKGTQKEALKRLTELQRGVDQGLPIPKAGLTVSEWLTRWLAEDVRPTRRIRTYERYESLCRVHIIPALGQTPLTSLAPAHIKTLQNKLADKGLAPASVGYARVVLHGALKAAVQQDLLARNVVDAVKPPSGEKGEVTPPEIVMVRRILTLAEATGHEAFPILHFLAYTGAREGEALGLLWKNVDLEKGYVTILQTYARARVGMIIQPPKTRAGRRMIDLDTRTIQVLQALQGQQVLQKMQAEGAYDDKGYVFCNALGKPIEPKWPAKNLQRLAHTCGLEHITLHSLRHFHASVLLASGQNIFEVSRRLGHASITTTADIYGHMLPGQGKKQADAFAAMMEREAP